MILKLITNLNQLLIIIFKVTQINLNLRIPLALHLRILQKVKQRLNLLRAKLILFSVLDHIIWLFGLFFQGLQFTLQLFYFSVFVAK